LFDTRLNTNLPQRRLDGLELLRDLERRFRNARDPLERAQLADRLVPELVSNDEADKAFAVLAGIEEYAVDFESRARLLALRGVVKAMHGESPAADIAAAARLLPGLSGPATAVVRHRAGVASFHARNALDAEEHSLAALALCERYGMRWLGARTASTLYGVYYHLTGDLNSARFYAELATSQADAAGDTAVRRAYWCAQYDLACVFADWDRAGSLRELLRRDRGHEAYSTTLPTRIADSLMLGRSGDFAAMRGRLESLGETATNTADRSLILALLALAMAGTGSKAEARSAARRALGLSNILAANDERVFLTVRRRLAGVLAAWISVIVGDTYHGMRALGVRTKWHGSVGALAGAFESEARGLAIDSTNPSLAPVRGYLAVAQRARLGMLALETVMPFALTGTELDVLRAVAQGRSNAAIALERGVTRNAIERRLMSAYEKLDVHTRGEAIAKISRLL
jgi:DNA-binding CsgD family transcriptional regulator